ncbi:flagellar motor protein MotB [Histidinibacterium aquaticum]|uniref:Chemotaxis protein MotB n=1 Tax=Histidinibacterium aquaticum TaxID=2613962 RepID=A0A5J5GG56_9RHOB|nr:flagellar motor protein MotB [Histidinibacterium aquaticum]KAA9006732.1 chemotaxis protein MotB [Histidinibacterium aquaticum]
MAAGSNTAPIIIKRKKVVGGDGHHGGAWKVAYADFVTAMMAFFMLMWLLNATTEQQRKGIADYFSPTIPINKVSGGGDGSFGGDNIFVEETLAESGEAATVQSRGMETSLSFEDGAEADRDEQASIEALRDIEDQLLGRGGESLLTEDQMRHVVTRVTDEGLIIELFDLPGAQLFEPGTTLPRPITRELARIIGRTFALTSNDVAVEGHVRSRPVVLADNPVWRLSTDRAAVLRGLMEKTELAPERFARVTGHADRDRAVRDALSIRNNRIEIILLRSDR